MEEGGGEAGSAKPNPKICQECKETAGVQVQMPRLLHYNLLEEVKRVAESAQRLRNKVNENMNLCSLIENHLKPGPWNHHLKLFCEEQLDSLKLFIRKYPKGTRSPFCELDIRVPIRQQLANLEEELEDNIYPMVFDLMKHETSSFPPNISNKRRCEKPPDDSFARPLFVTVETCNDSYSSSDAKKQVLFEDVDFAFDQGLIDKYSGLMAEINPDDFLDLECEFTKE
ncbi:hypothetical protein DVH24_006726 [Malus domestica]|uniref:BCD1 alpha/beta domain-containing protein n=1 Tax=Malus domestica TaxID=3750 RepID=A0A498KB92_MALDO|nr:hypothetical protein DVH24_006726 [Malus domestica]